MDSGNSSSMQSSSGGGGDQEEYDSRADQSISALFNNNNNKATTVSSNVAGQTQLDSLIANYFNTSWSTDNPIWSATTAKPTDGSRPPPPPPMSSEPAFFTNPFQQNMRVASNTNTSSPICSVPTDKKNGMATTRNLKKRSRVSRRAPTTVLTTDTSNFRAMVQEFTGNPSTPFMGLSSSSSFPRSRFDLFGPTPSASSSRPFKPFTNKLIPPSSSTSHLHLNPPSTDYHQSLFLNMNTQNIANPFLNNQSPNSVPLRDRSLSLRTSNGVGHVDVGTNFEGLHNIMASPSSLMTRPTLNTMHGLDKNSDADNELSRSFNMVERSDVYTTAVASGTENNLGVVVRNEGTVELSWISTSD